MKKKNYIPLILIIVFIIILIIVLTKIHKKDKFIYPTIPIIKNFKFIFNNLSAYRYDVDIKKINNNNEKTIKQLLKGNYKPGTRSQLITTSYDSLTTQLIYNLENSENTWSELVDIDNPEFYYYFLINKNNQSKLYLTIPLQKPLTEYNPTFIIKNIGDIKFEYIIKIIDGNNNSILIDTKNYNNKCNTGENYKSQMFSVPNNSIVSITYRSCILPGFTKTLVSERLYDGYIYGFFQTAKYSIFGPWYPELNFETIGGSPYYPPETLRPM